MGLAAENLAPRRMMKAAIYRSPGQMSLERRVVPEPGYSDALIRVRLASLGASDIAILRGEIPVKAGLILGHEAVGTIESLGAGVEGYQTGQRVLVGSVTPCGQCDACLNGELSQCRGPCGGWRLGRTIDGVHAEYALIPFAQANLAPIPDAVTDEDAVLLSSIGSTGFAAAEQGGVQLGDTIAVFGQGPIGLCAVMGAKLRGASRIYAVDPDPFRLKVSARFGATHPIRPEHDAADEILKLTGGRGVDVAIEALGIQETFEYALRSLRPGGTLSSVGIYAGPLRIPAAAIGGGLNDIRIVTTLCPGGRSRMCRLLSLVEAGRVNLKPLLTHFFALDEIHKAYRVSSSRSENVLKAAIRVE